MHANDSLFNARLHKAPITISYRRRRGKAALIVRPASMRGDALVLEAAVPVLLTDRHIGAEIRNAASETATICPLTVPTPILRRSVKVFSTSLAGGGGWYAHEDQKKGINAYLCHF